MLNNGTSGTSLTNWYRQLVGLDRLHEGKVTIGFDTVSMSCQRQNGLQELSCTICIAIFDIPVLRRCTSFEKDESQKPVT
jgi:hypothetical protein